MCCRCRSSLALELLDAALSRAEAVLIPLRLDVGVMQRQLGGAEVPALYRAVAAWRVAACIGGERQTTSALRARLAALASDAERLKALVELAQEDIAAVLALPGASSVPADVPLKELGLDLVDGGGAAQPAVGAGGEQAADDAGLRLSDAAGDARLLLEKLELGRQSCSRVERRAAIDAATAASEAVAIVGMSCRYPGVRIRRKRCGICCKRGGDAISGSRPIAAGMLRRCTTLIPTRRARHTRVSGGFLHRAAEFDAGFSASARARRWRSTRSSGCCWRRRGRRWSVRGSTPASLQGSPTGVFVGVDCTATMARACCARLRGLEGYLGTGSAPSVASGRIAYTLGLQGPAITRRHGVLVVAGGGASGVPGASAGRMRAGAGRRRDGDVDAGRFHRVQPAAWRFRAMGAARRSRRARTARAGAKALGCWCWSVCPDARRNGHSVLALVRGSAVNQDGRSQGLTAPNGPSQQQVIRAGAAQREAVCLRD